MSNFNNKKSRRTRHEKSPLGQDIIIRTAYDLLCEHGVSGMSMRKVAKALDTGAASLYVYVENHQKLSACVLDYGLHEVALVDDESMDWKDAVHQILKSYAGVLAEYPGLSALAMTISPYGQNSLKINECLLKYLKIGGMSERSMAWGIDILLLYIASLSFERGSRVEEESTDLDDMIALYNQADPAKYPLIMMLKSEMFAGGSIERFEWGIEVILQGMLAMSK